LGINLYLVKLLNATPLSTGHKEPNVCLFPILCAISRTNDTQKDSLGHFLTSGNAKKGEVGGGGGDVDCFLEVRCGKQESFVLSLLVCCSLHTKKSLLNWSSGRDKQEMTSMNKSKGQELRWELGKYNLTHSKGSPYREKEKDGGHFTGKKVGIEERVTSDTG